MRKGIASFSSASSKERLEPTEDISNDIAVSEISDTVAVTLDDIKPYENNPRNVVKNPAYDEIKASIYARGLDNPLKLTKRNSDDTHYILSDGGATRYAALVELWNETKDVKFYHHNFPFEPYTTELDLLIRHASENGNRGAMSWIENALQAQKIEAAYKEETGLTEISLRVLAEKITGLGLSSNAARLSEYRYTVDILWPEIPNALKGGMGRPKVRSIKDLTQTYSTWCNESDSLSERDFSLVLRQVLKQSDPADSSIAFDLDKFESLLHSEIAKKAGIDVSDVLKERVDTSAISPESKSSTPALDGTSDDNSISAPTSNNATQLNSGNTDTSTTPKESNQPRTLNTASSNPAVTKPIPEALAPADINARCLDRSKQALAIANDLFVKQCASLKESFTSIGDEQTAVALGFAVTAIDEDIDSIDIDPLDILVYCKLHQLFALSFAAHDDAGLLENYDLRDDIIESCKSDVYASVFWNQALLLSTTAYYDSLRIKSKLRSPVDLITEDELYVVNSLSQLEELLADHYLEICSL